MFSCFCCNTKSGKKRDQWASNFNNILLGIGLERKWEAGRGVVGCDWPLDAKTQFINDCSLSPAISGEFHYRNENNIHLILATVRKQNKMSQTVDLKRKKNPIQTKIVETSKLFLHQLNIKLLECDECTRSVISWGVGGSKMQGQAEKTECGSHWTSPSKWTGKLTKASKEALWSLSPVLVTKLGLIDSGDMVLQIPQVRSSWLVKPIMVQNVMLIHPPTASLWRVTPLRLRHTNSMLWKMPWQYMSQVKLFTIHYDISLFLDGTAFPNTLIFSGSSSDQPLSIT